METGTEVILSALPLLVCDFRACDFILMELNTFIYKIMNCRKLSFKVPSHFVILIPSLVQDHISFRSPSDFPGGSDGKASVYNAGDLGSISGWGRSPGEGNDNLLLWVTKNWTQLSYFTSLIKKN